MTLTQPPVPQEAVAPADDPTRASVVARHRPGRAPLAGAAFLAPAVALVVLLLVVPFAFTIYRSFFDDNGFTRSWVGLDNYTAMFTDPAFGQSVLNTFFWVVGTLVLPVGLGLAIAVGTWKLKLGALARFAVILPYAISGSATAVVWTFMLSTDGGLDTLLRLLGLDPLISQWLLQWPLNTVMMIVATTWQATGACVILFLVGLLFARFGQRLAQCLQLVLRLLRLLGDPGRGRAQAVEQGMDPVRVRLALLQLLAQRGEVAKDALGARRIEIGEGGLPILHHVGALGRLGAFEPAVDRVHGSGEFHGHRFILLPASVGWTAQRGWREKGPGDEDDRC